MTEPSITPCRILVIDDEPAICRVVKKVLTKAGHTVTTTTGSKKAIALLHEQTFDLVLLDIGLEEGPLAGFEVAKALLENARWRATKLIVVSGLDAEVVQQRARIMVDLLAGASMIITKPYDGPELLAYIERAVRAVAGERSGTVSPHDVSQPEKEPWPPLPKSDPPDGRGVD